MEDTQIVTLYWERNQEAIAESRRKYGGYCFTIANNLLADPQDSEECVSDTFWGAWKAMPPHRPGSLKLFLAKITRALAFNRFRSRTAQKRGGGELPLVLEELETCIAGGTDPEEVVQIRELSESINRFVKSLSDRDRSLFADRYFFTESMETVAKKHHITVSNAYVALSRIRKKLRQHLIKEGFFHE